MAQLDTELIAAAALAVLDKGGLKAFTTRNVAEVLGVTPMALYHHVRNKAELALLVVKYANNERPMTPPTGVWREDLWQLARWMREMRLAHPAVVHLLRMYPAWTPEILKPSELWVSHWRESGLDPETAVLAAQASGLAVSGIVAEQQLLQEAGRPNNSMFKRLPNARLFFNLRHDDAMKFELGVRSIIDGIYDRLKQNGKSVRPAVKTTSAKRSRKPIA